MEGRENGRSSRRSVLQTIGVVSLGPVLGSVSAAASVNEQDPTEFDPDDESEVKRASQLFRKIDNRGRFMRRWRKLTEDQAAALIDANSVESIDVSVIEEPDSELPHSADGDEVGTQTHTAESKQIAVISEAKNVFGNLLIRFRHNLYWEYNFSEVTYMQATHEATTHWPFWSFAGLSTNSRRIRTCQAQSVRVGQFNYSVTEYGLIQQQNIGSEINVQCDGAWSRRLIG